MKQFKEEYYNGRDRMNPTIENNIKNNTTDISNNPAIPSVDKDGNPINFIELIAYKRFLDTVKKAKYYTGIQDISGQNGFMQLQMKLQESVMKIISIEKQHRPYLEKLGIDLIIQEMELTRNAFKIDAEIVDMGTIEKDGFQVESKEPSKEQVENEFQVQSEEFEMTPMQFFELEKDKRRFINLLIQGASKKGHYMFELRRTELNKVHPELANLYGVVMSINDLTYWIMPENLIEQSAKNPQAVAGKEEIEEEDDKTLIKTQAICFPISIHENIKGVMEVFGTHGLPDSKEAQEMIFNSADTLINEISDIRLGVGIWEKFIRAYPMEVFEEGKKNIQHFIFARFCALDSDEFFEVSQQILSDNPKGTKFIQDMVNDIVRDMNESDLVDTLGNYDYDDDDEFKKGGSVEENLLKELHRLQRDLNSSRLRTYREGDTSEIEVARQRERESKLIRFNEVLQLLKDINEKYADGGEANTIGFIPMDLEQKLALLSKWGGTNIKGVIGYLNAMIDSGVTDNNLVINPTKNTRFQREKAVEKKIKEIWEKIEPQYKGNLKGNMYYSTLKELIERNWIYENLLQKFKPFRKYQKFDNGGMAGLGEVSGMLPSALPMSTITPMAKGGKVGYTKKDILNFIKQLKNIQEDILEYKKELDNKNLSEWEVDNIENNKLPELRVQESYIINQLQWGTKNYFSINGKRLVVNEEIYNFLKTQGIFADGGDLKDFSDNQLMIMNQNVELEHHHEELEDILKDETPVPAWAVSKIATATQSISDVTHYLDGQSKMAEGGEANEIKYLNNRIINLKQLLAVSNKDEKAEMIETIEQLEKDKENILNKTNKPIEIEDKKSFWLFKKGGLTELPKDKSKIHFTDNEGREYDGIFFEDEDMFYIGFKEKGDFRYIFEVVQWNYIDGENDDDAHAKHKKSETADDQYDVYDNKKMLENQANEIEHHSKELNSQVKITKRVPAWVIAKTERATTDLSDVTHYLDGENKMAYGGELGDFNYEIIPLPSSKKFIIVQVTNLGNQKQDKNIIRDFNANPMKFDDINSAQKFIDNIIMKYPFGNTKAYVGAILMASQLLQQQQQQQQQQPPQVVYYVPQEEPQEEQNTGIIQNIPEMASGGEVDNTEINNFCIINLIDLANDLQSVKYFTTDRFKEKDEKLKHYKGTLAILFKEPVSVSTVKAINKFIERAEDCHHLFEKSVNVSGSQPNSLTINLLSDKYSDREFKKGGKVYENTPKKINIEKTKKINTILGEYILSLITKDFVYFVNSNEGDENAQTIMYNKKGELLSDNIHATNDLFQTLETQDDFEFIHPDMEAYRQEILKGN